MKRSPISRYSKTEYSRAMRAAVVWHRKCVRLIWRNQCAFHGPRCRFYGGRGLEVHHIVPQSLSQRLKIEGTNGILLCPACHDGAESDPARFLCELERKWPAMHQAYVQNKESLKENQMPLRAFDLNLMAGELRDLCRKLEE